jgi:3-(3-hydroxy-phenyl)propionate hydroxylase
VQRTQRYEQQTQGTREQNDGEQDIERAVVIIGAGPTGLAAANLLGMAGIETLVIERNADLNDCPRAIAIDDEGLRICQAMGLSEKVMQHLTFDIRARYVSGDNYLAMVAPTSRRNGYPLVSTFHQPTFETTLFTGLERFSCVSVRFQHTLEAFEQDASGVSLRVHTANGEILRVRCRYLLACDGGQSGVRHALGISMYTPSLLPFWLTRLYHNQVRWGRHTTGIMEQRWLSIDCVEEPSRPDPMARDTGYFFCDYTRPAVSVPTPFGGRRWEFLVHPHERPEEMLDNNTVSTLIQQALAHAAPDICRPDNRETEMPARWNASRLRIIRRTYYTFHTAVAATFSRGRVFLLGDAAHMMPPFAGQGMNSGLRDAHNLCWKLTQVLGEWAHPRLLKTYSPERLPHAIQVTLLSSLPGTLLTTTKRSIARWRDSIFLLLNRITPLRNAVTELRIKPPSRYVHPLRVPALSRDYKKFVGLLLPQPRAITRDSRAVLLDEMLGEQFALLTYCETAREYKQLQALLRMKWWNTLDMQVVCLHSTKESMDTSLTNIQWRDIVLAKETEGASEQLLSRLRRDRRLCILVRPDRYILDVFDIRDARSVARAMKTLFCSSCS